MGRATTRIFSFIFAATLSLGAVQMAGAEMALSDATLAILQPAMSAELQPDEARVLAREIKQLKALEARALSDGVVDAREARNIAQVAEQSCKLVMNPAETRKPPAKRVEWKGKVIDRSKARK
mgnify:CR=1 FL=1